MGIIETLLVIAAIIALALGTFVVVIAYTTWLDGRSYARAMYFIPIVPIVLIAVSFEFPPVFSHLFAAIIGTWLIPPFLWAIGAKYIWVDSTDRP